MDCNLQIASSCWIIVLVSVFTLTENRLVYNQASSATDFNTSGRTIRPEAVKQQQSAELLVRPRPIVVRCHPHSMEVVVQADMFDTGLQVEGRHLRLGSDSVGEEESACRPFPSGDAEFTIKAPLMECGTKLSSTKQKIIYSNVLTYSPEPTSSGILRLGGATLPVECHYEKSCTVDGVSLHPIWVPFVSRFSADDQIDFSLQLMTDDWQLERGSYTYFLGDPIHLEVSTISGNHAPLRVYVDRCVATATPDAEAALRYDFIANYGCLAEAYLTNSSSHFLPRVEESKLRFQIDAFKFYQEPSNQVYITCYVKSVPAILSVSPQNRACSFIEKRWRSVDGNDWACESCDVSYLVEDHLSTVPPKTTISTETSSSMTSQEGLVQNRPKQPPVDYISVRPGWYQSQLYKPPHSSAVLNKGPEHRSERITQLGPLTVLVHSRFATRPSDSKTLFSTEQQQRQKISDSQR
uniref:Zona pellucida sperm-binding protein 3 n=1 Tax=Monopterus albus TaxID=43700 RepID=A0A3Q3JTP5_MONAL|nr:zona pellucida sperm-binding protein 3-like [Monopterus albus]